VKDFCPNLLELVRKNFGPHFVQEDHSSDDPPKKVFIWFWALFLKSITLGAIFLNKSTLAARSSGILPRLSYILHRFPCIFPEFWGIFPGFSPNKTFGAGLAPPAPPPPTPLARDEHRSGLDQDWSQFWPDQDWIRLQFFWKLADLDWVGLRKSSLF